MGVGLALFVKKSAFNYNSDGKEEGKYETHESNKSDFNVSHNVIKAATRNQFLTTWTIILILIGIQIIGDLNNQYFN